MDEKPTRRRKWLWIALGILVGVPAIFCFVVAGLFHVHALRPDQKQMPAGMIKTKSTATSASSATAANGVKISNAANDATIPTSAPLAQTRNKIPNTYQDIIDMDPNRKRAETYQAFAAKYPHFYSDFWGNTCMIKWRAGQPLTAEQKKWLAGHQEAINDVMKLAAAGGFPHLTHDQLMAMDPKDALNIDAPDYLVAQTTARLLAAETRRRGEEGDASGALETVKSILPLAESTREPHLVSHLIALSMQSTADRELAELMSKSLITADVARQLHDQLAGQGIVGQQSREPLELEYRVIRAYYVDMLSGSFGDLLKTNVKSHLGIYQLADLDIWGSIYERPIEAPIRIGQGTWEAVTIAANRSRALDGYDADYQQIFEMIDQNKPDRNYSGSGVLPTPNALDALVRTDANLALLKVNLIGLDLISGGTGQEVDPFTDQPLKTIQTDDSTTIYSIGPDRQDQGGAVSYDPTNGTDSAGDIFIRVPKSR